MRVHQDIVLTSQMLTEPNEMVLLLPAATRYEQPGGGTETTTERRVIFSPEIRGRRIGEARSEWEILMKLAETVYPDRADHIHFEHADEIRKEIAFANPHYDGIQNLKKQGDQFQWGGQRLCENYKFETPDGKARFVKTLSPPDLKPPGEGKFRVSTRRGKQFNSMVQAQRDPLTGAYRDAVFISPEDAKSMALSEGDPVLLRNDIGELKCRIKIAPLRPRNLQIHWPEGNVLLHHSASDPIARVPDYNAEVEIVKLQCDPAT